MTSKIQHWILLAAAPALLPASLSAQATGVVVGTVQDSSGAVVPAAQVRAVNQLTGVALTTASDGAGRFSFPRLPVGQYRIEGAMEEFQLQRALEIAVPLGDVQRLQPRQPGPSAQQHQRGASGTDRYDQRPAHHANGFAADVLIADSERHA